MATEVQSTLLRSVVFIKCPRCAEEIPVDIHISISPDEWWPEKIIMSTTPDLSPLWHHALECFVGDEV